MRLFSAELYYYNYIMVLHIVHKISNCIATSTSVISIHRIANISLGGSKVNWATHTLNTPNNKIVYPIDKFEFIIGASDMEPCGLAVRIVIYPLSFTVISFSIYSITFTFGSENISWN